MDWYLSLLYEKAGLHDSAIKMAEQVNVAGEFSEGKIASKQHTRYDLIIVVPVKLIDNYLLMKKQLLLRDINLEKYTTAETSTYKYCIFRLLVGSGQYKSGLVSVLTL